MAEAPDPAAQTPQTPETPTPPERGAEWTLIQLSGRLAEKAIAGDAVSYWTGRWVALNQRGEVYLYGPWKDCWDSAKHWAVYGPPAGAAEGEDGTGWRGHVPGLDLP